MMGSFYSRLCYLCCLNGDTHEEPKPLSSFATTINKQRSRNSQRVPDVRNGSLICYLAPCTPSLNLTPLCVSSQLSSAKSECFLLRTSLARNSARGRDATNQV